MNRTAAILTGGCLVAGMMWPSEGAGRGDGLHVVVLWLLAAAWTAATAFRQPVDTAVNTSTPARLARIGVTLLLAGIWIATLRVVMTHGDKRTALNLAFEWTGLAAAWWLTERLSTFRLRSFLLVLLTSCGVGSAMLGIAQHHVFQPQYRQWYLQKRSVLEAAAGGDVSARISAAGIQAEFREMQIPSGGPQQQLFERRLLDSTEPTGPFALANSLAGLLAAVLVLLVSVAVALWRSPTRPALLTLAQLALLGVPTGYVLLLTKSRTAWVGFVAGTAIVLIRSVAVSAWRRFVLAAAASTVLAVTVLVAAAFAGLLDREVFSEAPRSLQFRLMYWTGSASVLADHPLTGVGPGGFRAAYLRHKLPAASEEILDPHNILIDAWATAGMPGLAGMLVLLFALFLVVRQKGAHAAAPVQSPDKTGPVRSWILGAAAVGAAVTIAWNWLSGNQMANDVVNHWSAWASGTWMISAGACVTALCFPLRAIQQIEARLPACAGDAAVALLVHLLGAGGMQITGVMLILLVLLATATAATGAKHAERAAFPAAAWKRWLGAAALVSMAGVVIACGILPVRSRIHWQQLAIVQQNFGSRKASEQALQRAVAADPFAVDSRQQLAEVLAYDILSRVATPEDASRASQRSEDSGHREGTGVLKDLSRFEETVEQWLTVDPGNWLAWYLRGKVRFAAGKALNRPELIRAAVDDLKNGAARYPTNPIVLADWAEACWIGGQQHEAVKIAQKALEQDKINREWGHADRYLDKSVVVALRKIVKNGSPQANHPWPNEHGRQPSHASVSASPDTDI